ncbi:MAG TPA: GNAT family N-acetyltransferase [Chitinophagaceae bacterium]|nr:GNAT family N-acetyltransferase [Chitinophagaceae bacterium]
MPITRAVLSDVPELNTLINSAYRGESSKQGWTTEAELLDGMRCDEALLTEALLDPQTIFLKYTDNEKILGCVRLDKHGDKLYLGMLTVSPQLQGRGIGKELLKASEYEAAKLQCKTIYMTVISVRTELVAWYERHGYLRTGERKPFITEDARFGLAKMPLEFEVLEKSLSH